MGLSCLELLRRICWRDLSYFRQVFELVQKIKFGKFSVLDPAKIRLFVFFAKPDPDLLYSVLDCCNPSGFLRL